MTFRGLSSPRNSTTRCLVHLSPCQTFCSTDHLYVMCPCPQLERAASKQVKIFIRRSKKAPERKGREKKEQEYEECDGYDRMNVREEVIFFVFVGLLLKSKMLTSIFFIYIYRERGGEREGTKVMRQKLFSKYQLINQMYFLNHKAQLSTNISILPSNSRSGSQGGAGPGGYPSNHRVRGTNTQWTGRQYIKITLFIRVIYLSFMFTMFRN